MGPEQWKKNNQFHPIPSYPRDTDLGRVYPGNPWSSFECQGTLKESWSNAGDSSSECNASTYPPLMAIVGNFSV